MTEIKEKLKLLLFTHKHSQLELNYYIWGQQLFLMSITDKKHQHSHLSMQYARVSNALDELASASTQLKICGPNEPPSK